MLQIYNTLTRKKEIFRPLDPQKVGIYACGMTVYDYCHLGHGRLMVVFDTIVRWIRHLGYSNVTYVRNITNIDDKIIAAAKQQNTTAEKIACFFSEAMHQDEIALGNLLPDKEPQVTDFIPQIIAMITQLIKNKKPMLQKIKMYITQLKSSCLMVNYLEKISLICAQGNVWKLMMQKKTL